MTNSDPASLTALATRLSGLDPACVAVALEVRRPRSVGLKDAFDLAEELMTTPCIDNGLARFDTHELASLASGEPDHQILERCNELLLAADGRVFPEVRRRAEYWIAGGSAEGSPDDVGMLSPAVPHPMSATSEVRFAEGIVNVLLLNDLLNVVEQMEIRTTRTGHLSKASVLDLSQRLPLADIAPDELVTWARDSGLLGDSDGTLRLQVDPVAAWRGLSTSDKWLWLVRQAFGMLPPEARRVLVACRGDLGSFGRIADRTFPIDASWFYAARDKALGALRALGLASLSHLAPRAREALETGNEESLGSLIRDNVPTETSTFLVQQDLSVVAPGLLTAEVARRLDTIAAIESRGLASTYRLTSDSLNRALDHGETGPGIVEFLATHSATPLPQNVRYVITDTAERHGSITLRRHNRGTHLSTVTPALLNSLLVDSNLSALQLDRVSSTEARTRVDTDTVARLAEDAGYPRPRVLLSPVPRAAKAPARESSPWAEIIRRIQSETSEVARGWIGRQLELAVRSKQRIRVTVAMPGGERDFVLDPAALANGRLRGRDIRGAVERTLPVEFITAVGPAE